MALGDDYLTLADLKAYMGITDTVDDAELTTAISSTSRDIEKVCRRQFNDSGDVSARVYYPRDRCSVQVDDLLVTEDLVVETDDTSNGLFGTTWLAADYQLEPLNGVVDGDNGWPVTLIRSVAGRWFPCSQRASVRVTARWGWASVPSPVVQAAKILAAESVKLKDAPFGVAGYADWGPVRVRNNPIAMGMLARYVRYPAMVA